MKSKYLLVFLLLFIVFLGISIFPSLQEKLLPKRPYVFGLSAIPPESIGEIHIQSEQDDYSLTKRGSSWQVASFTASKEKVDNLLQSLASSTEETVVSTNKDNFHQFSIATSSAVIVSFIQSNMKDSAITIEIGKEGPDGNSFYARKIDGDTVYRLNGSFRKELKTRISDWREKQIQSLNIADITLIEISALGGFSLMKQGDMWIKSAQGKTETLSSQNSQEILQGLAHLSATDFYSDTEKEQIQKNKKDTITVKGANEILSHLTLYDDDAYYLIQKEGDASLYKVPTYMLRPLIDDTK